MPGLSDTAYPRLKPNPSAKELDEMYTPNLFEGSWVEQRTREPVPRIGLLVLLKTFQRLGYFVMLDEVPKPILQHIAQSAGYEAIPDGLGAYDASSVRRRHMALVRDYVGVSTWCEASQKIMADACRDAARTRDDLADIVNVALEELVRQRYELPAFNTILRAARGARSEVNQGYYSQVRECLSDAAIATLTALLARPPEGTQSSWDRLKNEPKHATTQRTRDFLEHLEWLRQQALPAHAFAGVPDIKVKQFAAEARSLDLGSIHDCADPKRLTLTAALVVVQTARALDDVADMFIRLVQKLHNHAYDALLQHQADHVERTDSLVATLHGVTLAYRSEGSVEERLNAIGAVLEPDADRILSQCEAHEATSGRNYLPFLTRFYSHQRSVLFRFLERVDLVSTSPSTGTLDAVVFLLAHKADRHDWLPIVRDEPRGDGSTEQVPLVDLSIVTDKWWPVVTGSKNMKTPATRVLRRPFELCVLTEVMQDLRSGDLSIPGSDQYSDYRAELVTEEEFQKGLASYGEKSGVPVEASAFVSSLKDRLAKAAAKADEGFPKNEYLSIEGGEATLKRLRRKPEPGGLKRFEKLVKERMEPVGILEALSDTEDWLNWTKHFGPISGNDPKLENPVERYLVTTFCYGFDFGPTQTSRSIRGLDRRQVAFVNHRHVTEETLNEAITTVVNGYSQCDLTKVWGLGKSASGDGTKWDLSPQNLMSQYHIRYGGYGGIGYYLVSDLYIALFSRFTTCGSWEGHHILDFIHENTSDVQPDTIHADTQGQSAAIFGLAYLLGIQLQPRIRNWKNLHFFRPDPEVRYKHIDLLFTKQVEWSLIETMQPEMLRVALSISAGRIKPSTILRRLATYSRKNKLYFAFRELGRVVRTAFLLDYISDIDLRRTIQAATNKSEAFNLFVQWVAFGGGRLLAENTRDEQRKMIKYHHLAANLLIFHNVVTMTKALKLLVADGHEIDEAALACFSPYQTEHLNRFGRYTLKRDRVPEPLDRARVLRMQPRSEGLPAEKIKTSVTF
jgi:TnpA family transposase